MHDPRFGKSEICVCRLNSICPETRPPFSASNLARWSSHFFQFYAEGQSGSGATQANSLQQAFNSAQTLLALGWLLLTGGYIWQNSPAAAIANQAVSWARLPFSHGAGPAGLAAFFLSGDSNYESIQRNPKCCSLVMDDFVRKAYPLAEEKLYQYQFAATSTVCRRLLPASTTDFEAHPFALRPRL